MELQQPWCIGTNPRENRSVTSTMRDPRRWSLQKNSWSGVEHCHGPFPLEDCKASSFCSHHQAFPAVGHRDVLGWFSPCTIKMKILFRQLWELKVDWDGEVSDTVHESWLKWCSEVDMLSTKHVFWCYHNKNTSVVSMELHGFSDSSELAYCCHLPLKEVGQW